MAWFPATFPITFNENLQPDLLVVLRTYLLTISTITDYVGQRIFLHTIPKGYTGTDCIVLSEIPSPGTDMNIPVKKQSIDIKCFSQTLQTARDISRVGINPALHTYTQLTENDGTKSFGNDYYIEIYETQSPILLQDPDFEGIYWYSQQEYEITLRY